MQETPFADDASYTLEDISVKRDMIYSEYPVFSSPSGIALAQEASGFDIIACATNHMLDQGIEGIDRTYHAYGDDTKVIGILPIVVHTKIKIVSLEVPQESLIKNY